jgi:hypothetical protein
MIIPLDKLFSVTGNKYLFTKAAMQAVDKAANIKDYPEKDLNWKIVPNILKLQLEGKIQFQFSEEKIVDGQEQPESVEMSQDTPVEEVKVEPEKLDE